MKARNDSINSARRGGPRRTTPPQGYYSGINFILDETSKIYFHDKRISCWNSEYEGNPPIMNLKEADILVLSYEDVKGFVDSIYGTFDPSKWKVVEIASTSDTINMKSYEVLNEQINKERRFGKAPLRLVTKEEREVLEKIKE